MRAYRKGVRWKLLLRPSWLALTLVVLSFAAVCYTLLAPWQFHRDTERHHRNIALQASLSAQPRPLGTVMGTSWVPNEQVEWQRVDLTGSYLPEGETIARLRTVQGEPAFEILAPFRTVEGDIVVVNRGYVRPDNRTKVGPYPSAPTQQVRVTARVRVDEIDPRNRDAFVDESTEGRLHSYTVNSQVVARATNLPIRTGYFQLDNDQPGVLTALPLPKIEAGPFFSYALQWIAFGTMAIFGWGYFTIRELRPGGALTSLTTTRKSVAEMLAEDERIASSGVQLGGHGRDHDRGHGQPATVSESAPRTPSAPPN